ncbi:MULTISPECIES: 30S ribosomal protein S7 [unclassified Halanaerobium]|uniref:30S ribosomal protein S7 n=1 Tax=unclassified Halanaerobium TaxID=2641197 RepID=UPI000DF21AB3|nr:MULTISPECIES: 30S ribosomal protein S7 [unclassified Halanaerobium]RCW40592.1 SSU ribosomal protein S7P [Halanaerobium sp. MA284_MarDTE_T2]RCW78774.1 SSU ribosomal protein S7P [Halanaerobium sp. DL-01]
MRKNRAEKREIMPDPIYNKVLISRIVNKLMLDGKKGLAENIFYGALDIIADKTGEDPIEVVNEALNNIMPALEVKSRRVGGSNYQVPVEVDEHRKITLSLRWLINAARARGERTMKERIASEIMEAFNNTGGAVRKKEEVHRMAEANRAFAHYRW